ncbi:MAG: GAF domain-containing protein [Anaerolineales bacterium]|nr:GAF domain-containing protein [Anaerolineales bacterium]
MQAKHTHPPDNYRRPSPDLHDLNTLTLATLQAPDLGDLLKEATLHLVAIAGAYGGYASIWDGRNREPRLIFESIQLTGFFSQMEANSAAPGLSEAVLEHGKPMMFALEDREIVISTEKGEGVRLEGAIAIPLSVGEEWLGSIVLLQEGTKPLSETEALFYEQVVGQVSLAVSKLQALEGERRRNSELEGLRRASLGLTSNLDLETVLDSILESTLELTAADDAHIFLYDDGKLVFGAACRADDRAIGPYSNPREHGLTYAVACDGKRIVIPNVDEHPLFADWQWGGAIAGLPLKIGDRVVGVMNIALMHPHEFDEAELRGLQLLADQAAIMIQNARLFERVVKERRNVELVYEVAQELANSFNQDEILERALASTVQHLQAHSGEIFLVEENSERLQLRASSRRDGLKLMEMAEPFRLTMGHGLMGWVALQRQSVLVPDVRVDDRWVIFEGIDEAVRTAVATPLISGGIFMGVMGVFQTEVGGFNQDHLQLLEAIARQVSLAISNARRYEALERRVAELSVVREVVQVVNQRLEMQSLLEEVVHQVGEVLGYPIVEIYLVDGPRMVMRAAHGGPMDTEISYLMTEGTLGKVARSGEPVYLPDVKEDPDYVEGWELTRSEIAVPLRKKDVVVGVLNVESPVVYGLTEDDVHLLNVLADQISIALENAALYDRLREHADALEMMVAERTAELADALNKARAADQLKTMFVSDVSHELRTPLSNIRLYLDLLRRGPEGRFDSYLQTLDRETNRLVALIEDLLAISSLDAGTSMPDAKTLHLNKIAEALAQDRSRLYFDRNLELRLDLEPDLPAVQADEKMISQVVANLMTNALNYTPQGGHVEVRTARHGEDGRSWSTLSVVDDGLGIPDSERERVFDRFFRGSITRQTGTPGTGLGLSICKEILERHQGRITLESEPGEGSTFTIWLPINQQEAGRP